MDAKAPLQGSLYYLFFRLLILLAQHPRYHKRAVAQRKAPGDGVGQTDAQKAQPVQGQPAAKAAADQLTHAGDDRHGAVAQTLQRVAEDHQEAQNHKQRADDRQIVQRTRLCGVGQHGRCAESVYFARQGQNSGQYGKCSCGRRDEHCAGCAIHKRFPYGCSGRDPDDHPLTGCVRRFCHPLSLHGQKRSAASPAEYSFSWEAPLAVYSAGNIPCANAHVR